MPILRRHSLWTATKALTFWEMEKLVQNKICATLSYLIKQRQETKKACISIFFGSYSKACIVKVCGPCISRTYCNFNLCIRIGMLFQKVLTPFSLVANVRNHTTLLAIDSICLPIMHSNSY